MMDESFNMWSMGESLPKAPKSNYVDFETIQKMSP